MIYTFQMGHLSLHPIPAQALNYKLNYTYNTIPRPLLSFHGGVGEGRLEEERTKGVGGSKLHCSKGIDHDCEQLSMWFQKHQIPELSVEIQILGDASTLLPIKILRNQWGRKKLQEKLHKYILDKRIKSNETRRL